MWNPKAGGEGSGCRGGVVVKESGDGCTEGLCGLGDYQSVSAAAEEDEGKSGHHGCYRVGVGVGLIGVGRD